MFLLDTGAATSVASELTGLSGDFNSLASTVSGFDTSCEESEFDFSGAKNAIAENIRACGTKTLNTSSVIDKVVSAHTALQGSLKFEEGGNGKKEVSNASVTRSSGSGGYSYTNNYYSAPASYRAPTTSVQVQSSPVVYPTDNMVASNVNMIPDSLNGQEVVITSTEVKSPTNFGTIDPSTIIGLPSLGIMAVPSIKGDKAEEWYLGHNKDNWHFFSGIHNVGCKKVEEQTIASDIMDKIEYNEDGYAMIDGRYVISCDKYFGNVSDKIQVITDDGVIECIIGYTSDNLDNNLTFYTNDNCNGEFIGQKVSVLNLKSLNNLEYVEGGSKHPSSVNNPLLTDNNKNNDTVNSESVDVTGEEEEVL